MRTLFDSPNKKKNFGSNSPDLFKNTKQKQLVLDPSCSYSYSPVHPWAIPNETLLSSLKKRIKKGTNVHYIDRETN